MQRPRGKAVLGLRAFGILETRVIRRGRDAGCLQRRGRLFRVTARRRIDERSMIPDETRQHRVLLVVAGHGTHAQVDVGPVETRYDNPRARKAEQFDEVVADLGRGGRGEGRERRSTRLPVCASARAGRVSQKPVVGPEVVTPLRDAMRLVDDEPRDRHVAEDADEGIRREALGRASEDVCDTAGERDRTLAPHRPVSGQIERQRQVAFGAQARRHAVPGMARAAEAVQQDDPLRHIAIVVS